MAAVRISPGLYKDLQTGRTFRAATQAEADKQLGGRKASASRTARNGLGGTINREAPGGTRKILQAGNELTSIGQDLARGNLENYTPFSMGQDVLADRDRMENEAYARLTRGLDDQYARDREQTQQELANRGFNVSNMEDAQVKSNMAALNKRYDDIRSNAKADAIVEGGQEYQRAYDIGIGSHNSQLTDAATLQGMGTGLTGADYDLAYKKFLEDKRANKSAEQIARENRRRGGGAAAAPVFNETTAPGVA